MSDGARKSSPNVGMGVTRVAMHSFHEKAVNQKLKFTSSGF